MSWFGKKLKQFGHWWANLEVPDELVDMMDALGRIFDDSVIDNLVKQMTGTGATDREKEISDMSLHNQQILNQEDYDRKVEFYEKYESPQALTRQYQQAGINPALMYQGAPSVSASGGIGAGSASASDAGTTFAGILSAVLGGMTKFKQIKQDREMFDDNYSLNQFKAETDRMQVENYGKYLSELTRGAQYNNDTFFQLFGAKIGNLEADTALKGQQNNYLVSMMQSEQVRRSLMESGIRVNDAQKAAIDVQRMMNEAALKYSDQYYKAVADVQSAAARMAQIDVTNYEKLQSEGRLYESACAELADVIIKAGMDADIYTGDAFSKQVEGKMTRKDLTQMLTKLFGSLAAVGAGVGVAAMRARKCCCAGICADGHDRTIKPRSEG